MVQVVCDLRNKHFCDFGTLYSLGCGSWTLIYKNVYFEEQKEKEAKKQKANEHQNLIVGVGAVLFACVLSGGCLR